MNPYLALMSGVARLAPRVLGTARTGMFAMPDAEEGLKRIQANDGNAKTGMQRLMEHFDHAQANRAPKADMLTDIPQQRIDKDFNDVSQDASPRPPSIPPWLQMAQAAPAALQQAPQAPQPMQTQPPVMAQGAPPTQHLPLPPEQRPVHEMPSAQVPHTPFNPAPTPPPQGLSFLQRNGMLQRDPETGDYLDPQMAQRALAAGGGLFG